MKKLLAILAVMAVAGSAMAAEGTVDVNVTINEYIAVEGLSHSATIDPVYDANGDAFITAVAQFLVDANVSWAGSATADSDWWVYNADSEAFVDGPSETRTGGPGLNNSQDFTIGKTINIVDGLSFGGTVTFTVN